MKMVYQARDKQNMSEEVVRDGKVEAEVEQEVVIGKVGSKWHRLQQRITVASCKLRVCWILTDNQSCRRLAVTSSNYALHLD
jgi:hypothetical protein